MRAQRRPALSTLLSVLATMPAANRQHDAMQCHDPRACEFCQEDAWGDPLRELDADAEGRAHLETRDAAAVEHQAADAAADATEEEHAC